jgi:predicted dehydrogenase
MLKLITKLVLILSLSLLPVIVFAQQKPVRIGVAGLTHDHIHGLLGRKDKGDIVIVGIVEPDKELVERYAALRTIGIRVDAFSYFANVIRGNIKLQPFDLSALPNNEMVVKILEAAKVSVLSS